MAWLGWEGRRRRGGTTADGDDGARGIILEGGIILEACYIAPLHSPCDPSFYGREDPEQCRGRHVPAGRPNQRGTQYAPSEYPAFIRLLGNKTSPCPFDPGSFRRPRLRTLPIRIAVSCTAQLRGRGRSCPAPTADANSAQCFSLAATAVDARPGASLPSRLCRLPVSVCASRDETDSPSQRQHQHTINSTLSAESTCACLRFPLGVAWMNRSLRDRRVPRPD